MGHWATFKTPWQLFLEKRAQNFVRFWEIFEMAFLFATSATMTEMWNIFA